MTSPEKIPVFRPLLEEEEMRAAREALELGWLGMGSYVGQFEAALALTPRSVETLNNLGIALASQGRIREAATLFERALALQPDFADAQRNLATAKDALKISR